MCVVNLDAPVNALLRHRQVATKPAAGATGPRHPLGSKPLVSQQAHQGPLGPIALAAGARTVDLARLVVSLIAQSDAQTATRIC